MNFVLYFFGSGTAFIAGIGLILVGVMTHSTLRNRWFRVIADLLALFGLILVAFSAVPLPYWLYGVASGATVFWLAVERISSSRWKPRVKWVRCAVAIAWVAAVACELPYHFMPSLPAASDRPTLYVVGDSISAGIGGAKEETWPRVLARVHNIEVTNLARAGATTADALTQADNLPSINGIVLVEIGGNDLLGTTTATDFEQNLEKLLGRICQPGRTVLMVELPLPPFANEFGRGQRRLAAEYGVALIPKRVLIDVLTGEGSTTDGLHLSRRGHERMAEAMWSAIGSVYGE